MSVNDCRCLIKNVVFLLLICGIKYSAGWKYNVETAVAIASEDPSTATKNIVTGAGVVASTALAGVCITNVWNPVGWASCAVAGVVGAVSAIVAPDYIAPDWRYVKCSPQEYKDRFNELKSKLPEQGKTKTNIFEILHYLNDYCGAQCQYPTRISPVGGDRCSGGYVKQSVVDEYSHVWYSASVDSKDYSSLQSQFIQM